MARLVLGVAGAAAGFAMGGPVGAQWGWMAGSLVGGLLTATKRRVSIDESGNQTTAEGSPRAIVHGAAIVAGNVIYAFPARKIETEQGGKGGSATATSVQYLRTYAIRICEGPVAGVIMVKQDGEIVYDARPNGVLSDEDNAAFLARCTIYLGGEDQLPAPDLEAVLGTGEVPAHRGTAYIVFADDDLTARGGAVPQYEFVAATAGEVTYALTQVPTMDVAAGGAGQLSPNWSIRIDAGSEAQRVIFFLLSIAPSTANFTGTMTVRNTTRVLRTQAISIAAGTSQRFAFQVAQVGAADVVTIIFNNPAGSGLAYTGLNRCVAGYAPAAGFAGDTTVLMEGDDGFGVTLKDGVYYRGPTMGLWSGETYQFGGDTYTVTTVGEPVPLADIVADIHARCGQDAADYDVSALAGIDVAGLVLASQGYTGADAIDTLRTPYFFDRAEYGGKIHYVRRGAAVVASLTVDDLVEAPDESTRADPITYPRKLHLKYQSEAVQWEVTQVTSERVTPDVRVVGEESTEVPVVLTAEQAQAIVAKLHRVSWADADGDVKFSVPARWLGLVTGDCIGLTLRGKTRRLRIVQIDDADGVRDLTCRLDRQSAYSATVTVIPVPEPSPTVGRYPGDTVLAVLDIPALTDAQDTLGYYVAGSGARAAWRGYQAQRSTDGGASYAEAATSTSAAVIGTLLGAVPAASPWYTDTTNAVRVQLVRSTQQLASVTDAAFLQRGGAFALGVPGGAWEILQYRDAVEEGDGIYTLRTLHRGQLGSDAAAHAPGALYVLLAGAVLPVDASSAWLGAQLVHRGVSLGNTPDTAATQAMTYTGRQQREWPVASLAASISGGVLTATWAARHRFGTDVAPVASVNFQGVRVVVSDGSTTYSTDTMAETAEVDVSAMSAPIMVTVAARNRYTGLGEARALVWSGDRWYDAAGAAWWQMYRLEVTATSGSYYCAVGEMQLAQTPGGANFLAAGLPTAQSSQYEDRSFAYAIDGTVGDHFQSALSNQAISTATPYWGTVACPAPRLAAEMRLWTQNSQLDRGPRDFALYGSNDGGASWTLIKSFVGVTGWRASTSLSDPPVVLSLL